MGNRVKLKLLQLNKIVFRLEIMAIISMFSTIIAIGISIGFYEKEYYDGIWSTVLVSLLFVSIASIYLLGLFKIKSRNGFMYVSEDEILIEENNTQTNFKVEDIEVKLELLGYVGQNHSNISLTIEGKSFHDGINYIDIYRNGQTYKYSVYIEYRQQIDILLEILNKYKTTIVNKI